MKPLTREWVNKAEGDYATAGRELRARKSPNYDAACFHAQQCAEADKKTAREAVRCCEIVRDRAREKLDTNI